MTDAEISTDAASRQDDDARSRARHARSTVRPLCAGDPPVLAKGYRSDIDRRPHAGDGIGSPSLYAAFGSKEALYAEALRYYRENYDALVWARFFAAATAREAVGSCSWIRRHP